MMCGRAGAAHRPDTSPTAARGAALEALATLDGALPTLVVVAAARDGLTAEVLSAVGDLVPGAAVVGMTTGAALVCGTYHRAGISVLALHLPAVQVGTALGTALGAGPAEVGRELARAARAAVDGAPGRHSAFLLLTDGLAAADQQEVVLGVHRTAGARVPVVGAAVADAVPRMAPAVSVGAEVASDAAAGVWLSDSETPFPVVVRHGWEVDSDPVRVTAVDGNRVLELGGRSAHDAYVQHLPAETRALDPRKISRRASTRPLGVLQADGTHVVRSLLMSDGAAMTMFSPVPLNTVVQVLRAEPEQLLTAAEEAVAEVLRRRPQAAAVLVFSCLAREQLLGERVGEESARLQAAGGGVPVFGVYTLGEFGRTAGVLGFHNASVSVVAL